MNKPRKIISMLFYYFCTALVATRGIILWFAQKYLAANINSGIVVEQCERFKSEADDSPVAWRIKLIFTIHFASERDGTKTDIIFLLEPAQT